MLIISDNNNKCDSKLLRTCSLSDIPSDGVLRRKVKNNKMKFNITSSTQSL